MDTKKDLWLRLKHYHFDHLVPPDLWDQVRASFGGPDASSRAFADKLARKLRWKPEFALRAIDEYKKFLYLGTVAEFPVTPPKVIDQVWHEHLLFSRGYREFCDAVLRRPFDHNPELVPADRQTAIFHDQYEATRDLYRAEFLREPPAAFWGVPKYAGRPLSERQAPKRRRDRDTALADYGDTPLYAFFETGESGGHGLSAPEFGGGESGGAGGGGDWGDGDSNGGGDSGGGDGDGGGDGGSGCSSGCGGGGD